MTTCDMKKILETDVFLFDLDGTLYLEGKPIFGALETIEILREKGKKVVFLTNNSSISRNAYIKKLQDLGFNPSLNEVYTSGDATIDYLKDNGLTKRVHLLGTNSLKEDFASGGIELCDENPTVAVLSYDKELTYEKLVLFTRLVTKGVTYIATHPDINCPAKDVYHPDIGSFMALIEKSTGKTPSVICGKPFAPIAAGIKKLTGGGKIAMIGDRLSTDILFGLNNDFLTILVLSGETTQEMAASSDIKSHLTLGSVKSIYQCFKN